MLRRLKTATINNYRLVAHTMTIMKCFERLIMVPIKDTASINMDERLQEESLYIWCSFICGPLSLTWRAGMWCAMWDCSSWTSVSVFNTPTLANKLLLLGLKSSLCDWVLDLVNKRPQTIKIRGTSSSIQALPRDASWAPHSTLFWNMAAQHTWAVLLFKLTVHGLLCCDKNDMWKAEGWYGANNYRCVVETCPHTPSHSLTAFTWSWRSGLWALSQFWSYSGSNCPSTYARFLQVAIIQTNINIFQVIK